MTNAESPTKLPEAAAAALRRGSKIEAIKIVRSELHLGLKEAKDLVDASDIAPSGAGSKSPLMTGEASHRKVWLWLVVIALAVGVWYGWA